MNKYKFNKLTNEEKVKYILNLNKDKSLNEISSILDMKKNHIKTLMERNNYFYNGKHFISSKNTNKTSTENSNDSNLSSSERIYSLELRVFELETIIKNLSRDIEIIKLLNEKELSNCSHIKNSSNNLVKLNDDVLLKINDFLNNNPDLNKTDLVNKAILDYINNYTRLMIYNKKK